MSEKDQKKQNPAPKLKPSIKKLSDKKKLDLILTNQVTTIGNTVALENRLIELRAEQQLQSSAIAEIYQHLGLVKDNMTIAEATQLNKDVGKILIDINDEELDLTQLTDTGSDE